MLWAIPAGLVVGALLRGSLDGLSHLGFRWAPLAVGGLLVQVVLFTATGNQLAGALGPAIYILSTLAVFIAVGTMISLAYYLKVVAAMWMRPGGETLPGAAPAIAGASPEADPVDPEAGRRWYLVGPALLAAAATIFFGIVPQPLVDFASHAGASLF